MSFCSSNKDCLSTESCIQSACTSQQTNKLSTGAYVGIGIGTAVVLGIIIAICVRANRSNSHKYSASQAKIKKSQDQGPAPLPRGYMKPVDLLQVAEQNRRLEEAEQLQMIQKQNQQFRTRQMYQAEALDGSFVAVPINQVYVYSQNSPVLQTVRPNNVYNQPDAAQYMDTSMNSYPDVPPIAQSFSSPYKQNNELVRNVYMEGAPVNIVGKPKYMNSNSFGSNQIISQQLYVDQDGNPYSYPVAPQRSESPQKLLSRPSNSSDGSKRRASIYSAEKPRLVSDKPRLGHGDAVRRDSQVSQNSVRSGKNLPSLPVV